MFELVVECLVFLLVYRIFKRGFLHDSKHADKEVIAEDQGEVHDFEGNND